MIIATAQSVVSGDVRKNGAEIRKLMRRAAKQGARLVHFTEGALSGYTRDQVACWQDFDFDACSEAMPISSSPVPSGSCSVGSPRPPLRHSPVSSVCGRSSGRPTG